MYISEEVTESDLLCHGSNYLSVSFGILGLELEPMLLNLGELESFRDASTILAKEKVRHHGVKVIGVSVCLEVSVASSVFELSEMIFRNHQIMVYFDMTSS